MKVWIDEDERYPDYSLLIESTWRKPEDQVEISEDLFKRFNDLKKAYDKISEELEDAMKSPPAA
jgi:hypothetical protein